MDGTSPAGTSAGAREAVPAAGDGRALALVLGGGNALGAYHLGACERLLAGLGREPDRIVGTSIGAVTGAILAGNAAATRLDSLRAFWRQAARPNALPSWGWGEARARESTLAGIAALLGGRPGLFQGGLPGLWQQALPGAHARGLNDHRALARTLERHVDFERLNGGGVELHFAALDMETGQEVWFDTRTTRIGPRHLLAATALPPLFPPVELDGRLLCDAGLANNLPVDRAFALERERALLCVAVDLFSLGHDRPEGLNGTAARAQDIVFASQTRRAVAAIARERELLRRLDPGSPPATLARLSYRAPEHQRALKALDFSRATIDERIAQGRADAEALLARLSGPVPEGAFVEIAIEARPQGATPAPA